jgi:hypothetical protein
VVVQAILLKTKKKHPKLAVKVARTVVVTSKTIRNVRPKRVRKAVNTAKAAAASQTSPENSLHHDIRQYSKTAKSALRAFGLAVLMMALRMKYEYEEH